MSTPTGVTARQRALLFDLVKNCPSFEYFESYKLCEMAFGDCYEGGSHNTRILNFRAEMDAQTLVRVTQEFIQSYNEFNSNIIIRILEELGAWDLDKEEWNLKHLDKYRFEFGREGSPVLYIKSPYRWWIDDLKTLQKLSKSDEFSIENDGTLRIWWD